MMTFRWSWIFTVLTLLVQLGNANFPSNDDLVVNMLHRREEMFVEPSYIASTSNTPMSTKNIGIIVACVVAGVAVSCAGIGWAYLSRSRRLRVPSVEEGVSSPSSFDSTWKAKNLRSQFSPDETKSYNFDRIRAAFGRRKKHEAILPIYNVALPAGSVESIEPPPPVAQGHIPRYPSILERGNSQRSVNTDPSKKSSPSRRASPPPPLQGLPELTRTPSSSSTGSRVSGPRALTKPPKRTQVPLKAVLIPPPGRPLPGLSGAKTAHTPKSPSKRRSWLSRHTFRHPFIPFRSPDLSLKFPPGSPLGGYHPSRQHLEARFDMVTPRVSSPLAESHRLPPASAKEIQRREHVIKRQPVPPLSLEAPVTPTRQVKIFEALQSAETEGRMTPTGYRTAISASASKPPKTPKTSKTPKVTKTVRILDSPIRIDSPVIPSTAYI